MNSRIEICGAIASGKTTLANAYSKFGQKTELEDFSKISMLDDFYSDPLSVSFETEISFTLQHYYQIKKALRTGEYTVCDFSSVDDYAFALAILNEKEMEIYNQIFSYVIEQIGKPQKLIKLYASADELISRIKNRGRENEQSINKSSLLRFEESLSIAIERFYDDVPLIKINTEEYSPSDYCKGFLENL
nr:deoxynucleoside kinase [Sedimentibacter sp.]